MIRNQTPVLRWQVRGFIILASGRFCLLRNQLPKMGT
jgi:hypothetical protein